MNSDNTTPKELDFNEPFNVVLEHYETKLKEAEKEIAKFIKGYLGKRTIADVFSKASPLIKLFDPILHYSYYQKSRAYKAIQKKQAIHFLNEYESLPRMMIRKGIVFKDYFDFISLIENKEYQVIRCECNEEYVDYISPSSVFEACNQHYAENAVLFTIIYLDAKIMRYVDSEAKNIHAITYRALLEHPVRGLNHELYTMKRWFEHNINHYINWNNFNRDYSSHPWGDRKDYLEGRLTHLRQTPDYRKLIQDYLKELKHPPLPDIMPHFDKILYRKYKLSVFFIDNKTIELSFIWDCDDGISVPDTIIKPPRRFIGANECAMLKTILSNDVTKRIPPSNVNIKKVVSDINIYFWQNLLIGVLITPENKGYILNRVYKDIISTRFGRPNRSNGNRRAKKI